MDSKKYIGMDVHQATISVAVRDSAGKLVMESILETKANTILEFMRGLGGSLWVTCEEGTSAAWLYDLLKPHVAHVVVCDPRKNALLKAGNKNDRVDPRKLTDLLRAGLLSPVYHGECGVRTLQELARSYLTVTKDLTRVMNRLKALYRSWAIACAGEKVYAPRHRSAWLEKLLQAGVRRREELYQPLDNLVSADPSRSPAGIVAGKPEASRQSVSQPDPATGPGSGCPADRAAPDTPSFPYQATTVGVLRAGIADAEQRGIPVDTEKPVRIENAGFGYRP
jgi:Transposase